MSDQRLSFCLHKLRRLVIEDHLSRIHNLNRACHIHIEVQVKIWPLLWTPFASRDKKTTFSCLSYGYYIVPSDVVYYLEILLT